MYAFFPFIPSCFEAQGGDKGAYRFQHQKEYVAQQNGVLPGSREKSTAWGLYVPLFLAYLVFLYYLEQDTAFAAVGLD